MTVTGASSEAASKLFLNPITIASQSIGVDTNAIIYDYNHAAGLVALAPAPADIAADFVKLTKDLKTDVVPSVRTLGGNEDVYLDYKAGQTYPMGAKIRVTLSSAEGFYLGTTGCSNIA